MIVELVVRNLGVIENLTLILGPGVTAVTGETGAGKTLIVEAIELLVGGRADGLSVRTGAVEAVIEGRFIDEDDHEVILRRVVPRDGRSRAYINGSLATVSGLSEAGRSLVDLHGQHDHQSLLGAAMQRKALDRFAGVDLEPLRTARKELASIDDRIRALGGDERDRARELDLLRFQIHELERADLADVDEDTRLEEVEALLADALAHQDAASRAAELLTADRGVEDQTSSALAALEGRVPFADVVLRLRGVLAELNDVATEVRSIGEHIDDDPERLAMVRERRQQLHVLKRKYGDTLGDVIDERERLRGRLDELVDREAIAAALDENRSVALASARRAEASVGRARRKAAPKLAAATESNLRILAMPTAVIEVDVGADDPGDDVIFRIAANPGSPPLPLSKVASGGELSRSMLALRLVLTEAPGTLVFDEVDAGIGGTAALAVGKALAELGERHQVLVVTHLPHVAAHADAQILVKKSVMKNTTTIKASSLDDQERIVELSRMLSGSPDSKTAHRHGEELLASAREHRTGASRRRA